MQTVIEHGARIISERTQSPSHLLRKNIAPIKIVLEYPLCLDKPELCFFVFFNLPFLFWNSEQRIQNIELPFQMDSVMVVATWQPRHHQRTPSENLAVLTVDSSIQAIHHMEESKSSQRRGLSYISRTYTEHKLNIPSD
jgi:hypothetical protein